MHNPKGIKMVLVIMGVTWLLAGCSSTALSTPAGSASPTPDPPNATIPVRSTTTAAVTTEPTVGPDTTVLGVGFGAYYDHQPFIEHLYELGVRTTYINLHWDEIEPTPGNYDYTLLDSYLEQLRPDTATWLRITARHSRWATRDEEKTVPADLTMGGQYYTLIYNIVEHTGGRVAYFENEWEPDCGIHWSGTAEEYAEMTRTFYAAVKAANTAATVVMGGSVGTQKECTTDFFTAVFDYLAGDQPPPFEMFDVHLYGDLYNIPDRIQYYRALLENYPAFEGTPIVVTEYGGPSPNEFAYVDEAANRALSEAIRADICVIGTDMSGYPDAFRMFAYGNVGVELAAKRDRIQGRQMVQRSLMALSAGVEKLFWWNMIAMEQSTRQDCYYRSFVFGKMQLMHSQPDGTLAPNPTFWYYQTLAVFLGEPVQVVRVIDDNPEIYLYEVTRRDGETLFVLWEMRDQFYGEDQPTRSYTLAVPWEEAWVQGLFDEGQVVQVHGGETRLEITDSPIFIMAPPDSE